MQVWLKSWLVVVFLFQAGTAAGSDAAPSPVDEPKSRPIILSVEKTIGHSLLSLVYEINHGLKDRITKLQSGELVVTPFWSKEAVLDLERQVAELKKQLTNLQELAIPLMAKNAELTTQVERSERLLRERTAYLADLEKQNTWWIMVVTVGAVLAIFCASWLWHKRKEIQDNSNLRQQVKDLTEALEAEHWARIYGEPVAIQAAVLKVLKEHGIAVPTIDGGCYWPKPRPAATATMVGKMLVEAAARMAKTGTGFGQVIEFKGRKK